MSKQSRYALRDKKSTPHSLNNSYTEKDPQYYTSKSKSKSKSKMSRPHKKKTSRKYKRQNGTTSTARATSSPPPPPLTLFGGNQTRKGTPEQNDVLSGRGGNINSHHGNVAFRRLVAGRKNDYNLTTNKEKKAAISQEIIQQVHDIGGKFLRKENDGSWVELEMKQTLAKTSQALREGAPSIRASAGATGTPGQSISATRTAATRTSKGSKESKRKTRPSIQDENENQESHPLIVPMLHGRGKQLVPRPTSSAAAMMGEPKEEETTETMTSKEQSDHDRPLDSYVSVENDQDSELSSPTIHYRPNNKRIKKIPLVDKEAETPPLTNTPGPIETVPSSLSLPEPCFKNNHSDMGSLLSLPNFSSDNNNNNLISHRDHLLSPSPMYSNLLVADPCNNNIQNHALPVLPPPQRNLNRENSLLSSDINGSGDNFVGNEAFADPFVNDGTNSDAAIDGYFDFPENTQAIITNADAAAAAIGDASVSNNGMSIHSEAPDTIFRPTESSSRHCSKLPTLSEIQQASDSNDIDDDFIQPVSIPCPHNTRFMCFRRTVSKDNLPLNTKSSSSSSSCICDIVRNQGAK